jgi:L-rhamnose mutarotase
LAASRSRIAAEPVCARWQSLMAQYTEPLGKAGAGIRVAELQEVFHLN